ncbi:MAG TPA: hypothetical protein VM364_11370 [Vicinamibacterales bacterium]|nr:hypothetical protein [Vicinamibacterales bacterium]
MRVTVLSGTSILPPPDLDALVVRGAERAAQRHRLRGPLLLLTVEDRPIALAAFRMTDGEFQVTECALLRKLAGDEELAEVVIDTLETVALACGASRLVIYTASRVLRRVIRLVGYVPRATPERTGFERRFPRTAA